MLSPSAHARSWSCGTAFATISRPEASQPLSTLDANGVTGLLGGSGQVVSFSPVCGEYQFQNCPDGSWRSMPSRVVSVIEIRSTASPALMKPRSRAANVAQKYIPMLVGDVYPERVLGLRLPEMLSAGRPVFGSTRWTKER